MYKSSFLLYDNIAPVRRRIEMRFGYACLNMTTKSSFRTCRLATAEKEGTRKIKELTIANLKTIYNTIDWNVDNGFYFYRMTSDVVPFATHEVNIWNWWEDEDVLRWTTLIKNFVKEHDFRLSIHPGQHSPLNTINDKVLTNTYLDFIYHDRLLELMGGNDMITHTGGVYGDKEAAKKRFAERYLTLSGSIKKHLRLENDDKSFTVQDVLDIHDMCGVPICLDIHHHNCNPSGDIRELFPKVVKTWEGFGTPKTHISTGEKGRTHSAHADYVTEEDLLEFIDIIGDYDVDIMFECKKKELSPLSLLHYQRV
jgi:UV DNA damage endonuclease